MEIILGKTAGFCYGVKRAVEGVKEQVENSNEIVFCLGEIVHNKEVIKELKSKGVTFIDNIDESKGKTIIRAHGVEKKVYEKAKKQEIELIDYTCPNVLKIHEIVEDYYKQGYFVFLCGSKEHPENKGTISYCEDRYYIIEKEKDIWKALDVLKDSGIKKLLVIVQTTYSLENFYIIEEIIGNELPCNIELVVKNTICKATELRQKETEELSKQVDYMIIIGGENSSNTRKLYEIAKCNCKNSVCVETESELKIEEIKKYQKVGIMAGASTPQSSIQNVINALQEYATL